MAVSPLANQTTSFYSRIWDTSTGQCLRTLVYEDNPAVASVCFSPNGRFVLASYTDSCIRLWDFINTPCTVKKTYQGHINKNYSIGGCFGVLRSMRKLTITINANGNGNGDGDGNGNDDEEYQEEQWEEADRVAFVTSASEEGDIVLWDVKSKEILQRVSGVHDGVCFWVDVHGETGTMVSCGQDGRIVVCRHRDPKVEEVALRVNGNGTTEEQQQQQHKHKHQSRYPQEEESSEERAIRRADESMDVSMREDEAVTTNGQRYLDMAADTVDASILPSNEGDVAMEG